VAQDPVAVRRLWTRRTPATAAQQAADRAGHGPQAASSGPIAAQQAAEAVEQAAIVILLQRRVQRRPALGRVADVPRQAADEHRQRHGCDALHDRRVGADPLAQALERVAVEVRADDVHEFGHGGPPTRG
jgi:hypothetical protein